MATEAPESTSNGHNDAEEPQEAPASPPLPEKHTAVTPGPRATRMQELFASSLRHTLGKISWENVAACYPTIAATRPEMLRDLRGQMVERLGMLCHVSSSLVLLRRSMFLWRVWRDCVGWGERA